MHTTATSARIRRTALPAARALTARLSPLHVGGARHDVTREALRRAMRHCASGGPSTMLGDVTQGERRSPAPPAVHARATPMSRRARFDPAWFIVVAAVALAAGGCMVGPRYSRPEVPTPPAHRFVAGEAQAESIADAPWWSVVRDPVLQALVREAIAKNLDLRTATARVAEARAQYGIARSFLFPQVGLAAGYDARQASRLSEPPQGIAAGRRTRTGAPRSRCRGRSTSSAASGARSRRPSPRTSRPSRADAPRSSRSWATSRRPTCFCASWTCSSTSRAARSRRTRRR